MPATTTLRVRHVPDSDPPRFYVERPDGKNTAATPAEVPPPTAFPVDGRPGSHLAAELRWYLEIFLDYPFPPETEHADRVLAALRRWGEQAFNALFDNRQAGGWLAGAASGGYERVLLEVWSDDPRILAWPWEALRDPQASVLAATCRIERHLNRILDPVDGGAPATANRVHILLVIARPLEGDVKYRSIARPLVELIASRGLPARVHVLRPPTFDALRRHLAAHPGEYHLVHFDGHGGYGAAAPLPGTPHTFGGPQGSLLFENDDGSRAPVDAETLSALLREHRVPAVVLNACQSAMIDERAADPFASVAAALLGAGTRSVVAMSYKLYVSGAREFLPAFYERLFETGSFAEAARAGRQRMLHERGRICARGRFPLEDWLVPVLYQQQPDPDLSFAAGDRPPPSRLALPEEVERDDSPYGFVGRDGPLLEIERALRQQTPAVLLQGLGGVGKTTLVKGLVRWLASTDGLGEGCVWLSFQDIRSAEYVLNRLGEPLFGSEFEAAAPEQKVAPLAKALRERRLLIVWDNFEVVCGAAGFEATLSETDRGLLRALLQGMRGGKTKVVMTSRSEEAWLGPELRRKIALGGLDQEERWEYCEAILRELGRKADRSDREQVELMDLLGGHPLAMRVVLLRLGEGQRAGELVQALRSNLHALGGEGDEAQRKLYATLKLAEDAVPEELKALLVPLGMHEGHVQGYQLELIAHRVDQGWTQARVNRFLALLVNAGLLRVLVQAVHEMHPALTGYLRAAVLSRVSAEERDRWSRAFVDQMGQNAQWLSSKEHREQRIPFLLYGANFHYALMEAERLGMQVHQCALLNSLGAYAENVQSFSEAAWLYERLTRVREAIGDHAGEAGAYHLLGIVAFERRDFNTAELWCKRSLAILEKCGNEPSTAESYHMLGAIAQERQDFDAAELWYKKSLAINEKHGNERGAAGNYHMLAMIAEKKRRDLDTAELWYKKAIAIYEKHGNEQDTAASYHQLGTVALERRDFDAAELWYKKSLTINEKHGNEHGAAITYHYLGTVALGRRDFDAAELWYKKSLTINEKHGNEHGAAMTYHQLGMVAQQHRDFDAAELWSKKSLAINEKHGNEHDAASTCHQLGIVTEERRDFDAAEFWYKRSLAINEKHGDEHGAARIYQRLGRVAEARRDLGAAELWYKKVLTITEKHGNEGGAASTYHNLGNVAKARRDLGAAELWYKKALAIIEKRGDEHGAVNTYIQLSTIAEQRRNFDTAELWCKKALAIIEKHSDEHSAALIYHMLGMLAEQRRDFDAAELWHKKSLAINEKHGNEGGAASTYYHLANVAEARSDFDTAELWYKKSLAIIEKHGNEHDAANTYLQLGRIAEAQRDFDTAELWYKKSLAIIEKHGNESGAASIYYHLANVARGRRDFDAAELWCKKSLAITEKHGDEHGAARIYGLLGTLQGLQGRYEEAGRWFVKSISTFMRSKAPATAIRIISMFFLTYRQASPPEQTKLRSLWESAGIGPFPEDAGPSEPS